MRPLIGIVLGGERGLYNRLNARQNLRYWAALYKLDPKASRATVERLLERVGLTARAGDRVQTYSWCREVPTPSTWPWSPWWRRGTCSSRTFPESARPPWPGRWPRRSTASGGGCHHLRPAPALHGDRHPEPAGASGYLPAARQPARPVPHADIPRVPGGRARRRRAVGPNDRVLVAWAEAAEALAEWGMARRCSETLLDHAARAADDPRLPERVAEPVLMLAGRAGTASYSGREVGAEEAADSHMAAATIEDALRRATPLHRRLGRALAPWHLWKRRPL